jgi:hypothetical protein
MHRLGCRGRGVRLRMEPSINCVIGWIAACLVFAQSAERAAAEVKGFALVQVAAPKRGPIPKQLAPEPDMR